MNTTIHRRIEKWTEQQKQLHQQTAQLPIKVLQIGEGNFLRGFFDWMIHSCRQQGLYEGAIAVTQPRISGKPKIDALAAQEGVYTLVIRGLENGINVERREIISVFGEVFDPYSQWNKFLELAKSESLEVVVSNTTEAGLVYKPEALKENEPIHSYPGKLTKLLFERYTFFNGDPSKGLVCLPCELLERNGDRLRECVLQYSEDWGYPDAFKKWILEHNQFLNSLVDRIVTGYPDDEQAFKWFEEWGYKDGQLTTAEPYHLWAIEADADLERLLPLQKAGLNVHWVEDLKPYQTRKVRILNGAHTLMTPIGILHGMEQVRQTIEHEQLGAFVKETVEREIIPALPMGQEELCKYAAEVYERFLNPFIRHRLSDIAMNSLSKFTTRLLPSLLYYIERGEKVPQGLLKGFAGLLRYYKVEQTAEGYAGKTLKGESYLVRDDETMLAKVAGIWREAAGSKQPLGETIALLLAASDIWGCNVAELRPALTAELEQAIVEMERAANE